MVINNDIKNLKNEFLTDINNQNNQINQNNPYNQNQNYQINPDANNPYHKYNY